MRNTIVPPKNRTQQAIPAPVNPVHVKATQCGFCNKVRTQLNSWTSKLINRDS